MAYDQFLILVAIFALGWFLVRHWEKDRGVRVMYVSYLPATM